MEGSEPKQSFFDRLKDATGVVVDKTREGIEEHPDEAGTLAGLQRPRPHDGRARREGRGHAAGAQHQGRGDQDTEGGACGRRGGRRRVGAARSVGVERNDPPLQTRPRQWVVPGVRAVPGVGSMPVGGQELRAVDEAGSDPRFSAGHTHRERR